MWRYASSSVGCASSATRTAFLFIASTAAYGVLTPANQSAAQPTTGSEAAKNEQASRTSQLPTNVDIYGDPLPDGAIARLGTVRYRQDGWYRHIDWVHGTDKFVVGGDDDTARFWDAATGKMVHEVDLKNDYLNTFRISPDGKLLGTVSQTQRIQGEQQTTSFVTWDTSTYQELHRVEWRGNIGGSFAALAFSPDGFTLAVGRGDGELKLMNRFTGEELLSFPALRGEIESLEFSPDGKSIAMAGGTGAKVWRYQDEASPKELVGLPDGAQVVRFSPDGKILAIGSRDEKAARLYDAAERKFLRQLDGAADRYSREGMCFSADGQQLFVPARESGVEVFDVESGDLVRTFEIGTVESRGTATSSDGKYLASAGSNDAILVWDLDSGERISDRFVGHGEEPSHILFTPDGSRIVTSSRDASIRIWEASSGRPVRSMWHDPTAVSVALSPDGRWIASAGFDDTVRLWDFASGQEKYHYPGHGRSGSHSALAVAFSGDGQRFYSFGMDFFLRSYDVATGRILTEHAIRPTGIVVPEAGAAADPFGGPSVGIARFNAAGTLLILGNRNGNIFVIDPESGEEIDVIQLQDRLQNLALSSDGLSIFTVEQWIGGVNDGVVDPVRRFYLRKRAIDTNRIVSEAELGGWGGYSPTVSDEGALLAVPVSQLEPLRSYWVDVYDAQGLQRLARIPSPAGNVNALAYSPDEKCLAVSYVDSTVILWDLSKFGDVVEP